MMTEISKETYEDITRPKRREQTVICMHAHSSYAILC